MKKLRVQFLLVVWLAFSLAFPNKGFMQDTVPKVVRTQSEFEAQIESLKTIYGGLLAGQNNLPQAPFDATQQNPTGTPSTGCAIVTQLDEQTSVPSSAINLVAVQNAAEAKSGNVYYKLKKPGNAQIALSPNSNAPGMLYFTFAVKNTGNLNETIAKIETVDTAINQRGEHLFYAAPRSGWTTFVGNMAAQSSNVWVLTLATNVTALTFGGDLEFDAIKVLSCAPAPAYVYMPSIADRSATCAIGQIGQVMDPVDTLESVANTQYVEPGKISVVKSGGTRIACWGEVQTTIYQDGKIVNFLDTNRAELLGGVIGTFDIASKYPLDGTVTSPVVEAAKPYVFEKPIGISNKPPIAFTQDYAAPVNGFALILGLSQGVDGLLRYIDSTESPGRAYKPIFLKDRHGDDLPVNVAQQPLDVITGTVFIYEMKTYPTDDDSLKLVVTSTCVVYCQDAQNQLGWVLTKQKVPGIIPLDSSTYLQYTRAIARLDMRYRMSSSKQVGILPATKEKIVSLIGKFWRDEPLPTDALPPLQPPFDEKPSMGSECTIPIEDIMGDSGDAALDAITYLMDVVLSESGALSATSNDTILRAADALYFQYLKDPTSVDISYKDVSYAVEGPPWKINTEAHWMIAPLQITVVFKCKAPLMPHLQPFALFEPIGTIPGMVPLNFKLP